MIRKRNIIDSFVEIGRSNKKKMALKYLEGNDFEWLLWGFFMNQNMAVCNYPTTAL